MTDIADRSLPLPPTRPERVIPLEAMGAVGDVARPLTPFERLANNTLFRRLVVLLVLGAAWEAYARFARQSAAVPEPVRDAGSILGRHGTRPADRSHPHVAAGARRRLRARAPAGGGVHHGGGLDPCRHRPPVDPDRHVQSAAGDRALAAGAVVVRARRQEPDLRHHPLGPVGGRAQHPFGLHLGKPDPAHGRAELRPARASLCGLAAGTRRLPVDPDRSQDRLGVRLAHADRRRAGVRRKLALGRARLVHFREPQPAGDRLRVRRAFSP